jgi:hypothetical protein
MRGALLQVVLTFAVTASSVLLLLPGCAPILPDGAPLTTHPGKDEDPSLIRSLDGRYVLAWFSDRSGNADIWLNMSPDGRTWGEPVQVTRDPALDFYASIAQTSDGKFHIAWFRQELETHVRNIWYSRSKDGRTWSEPMALTTKRSEDWVPSLLADREDVLHVVWASGRSGNKEILSIRSEDGGGRWSAPHPITRHPQVDDFPNLFQADDGRYLLAWTRYKKREGDVGFGNETAEILVATSLDGLQWKEPIPVTRDGPEQLFVDVFPTLYQAAAGGACHVAWTSNRTDPFGDVLDWSLAERSSGQRSFSQFTQASVPDYSVRLLPMDAPGQFLMVWVSDPGRKGKTLDLYHQILERPL